MIQVGVAKKVPRMMSNAQVNVIITLLNGSQQHGVFKWRLEVAEMDALRIVVEKLRDEELCVLRSIDLVPIAPADVPGSEPQFIPWLKTKRVYDFTHANLAPAPAAAPAASTPVAGEGAVQPATVAAAASTA